VLCGILEFFLFLFLSKTGISSVGTLEMPRALKPFGWGKRSGSTGAIGVVREEKTVLEWNQSKPFDGDFRGHSQHLPCMWTVFPPRASERAFPHPMDFCLCSSAEGVRSASEHRAEKSRISQQPSLWCKSVERSCWNPRKNAKDVRISD